MQCTNCTGENPTEIVANERQRAAEFSKKMNEFSNNMQNFGKRMSNMGNRIQLDVQQKLRDAFSAFKF